MPVTSSSRSREGARRCLMVPRVGRPLPGSAQELVDAGGELVDLGRQGVYLVEQDPCQLGVVVVEAPLQCLAELAALVPEDPFGQLGQHCWVTLTGDQGLEHGPARHAENVAGNRRYLHQGVFEQFLYALFVAAAFGHQV